jgi:putative FmdB family regulatory protein
MPIYEYECEACGNRFELIQKFSDPLVEICPKCGARKVRKLLSSPAIKFKGTGWYITDYAKKGSGESESSKSGDKGETKAADKSAPDKSDKSDKSGKSSSAGDGSGSSSGTSSASDSSSSSGKSSSSSPSGSSSSGDKAPPASTPKNS